MGGAVAVVGGAVVVVVGQWSAVDEFCLVQRKREREREKSDEERTEVREKNIK